MAVFILFAGIACVPILLCRYPPLLDAPIHAFTAQVLAHPGPTAGAYSVSFAPVPDLLWQAVLAGLAAVMSPIGAERLLLLIYAVALPAASGYLCWTIGKRRIWPAYLAFPLIWNVFALQGFLQFIFTLPLGVFTIAVYWRHRAALRTSSGAALSLLLLLCYLGHFVVFWATLVTLFALAISPLRGSARRGRDVLIVAAPALALTAWYVLLFHHADGEGAMTIGPLLKVKSAAAFLLYPLPLGLVAVLGAALALPRQRRRSAFSGAVAAVAALWIVSPIDMPPIYQLDTRFLLFALLLAPPIIADWAAQSDSDRWLVRGRRVAVVATGVSLGLALVWFASFVPGDREFGRLLRRLPANAEVGVLVHVDERGDVGENALAPQRLLAKACEFHVLSLERFACYYEIERGGHRGFSLFQTSLLRNRAGYPRRASLLSNRHPRRTEQENRYLLAPLGSSVVPGPPFRCTWPGRYWRLYERPVSARG